MRLCLGADHRGAEAVQRLAERLRHDGHTVSVTAPSTGEPCDYPDPAWHVAMAVARGEAERGILLCGTGVGMAIVANKVPGVRAALVHDEITAEVARAHIDANVLCVSADLLGLKLIEKIVGIFLARSFDAGRHARRVAKISAIEAGQDPRGVA